MELKINKEKFEVFLEVARALNKSLGVIPILYGSLGLYKIIGEVGKVNDVDILVPGGFVYEKWNELLNLMQELGFELKDEHEHEFTRKGEIVAFASDLDLVKMAKISPDELRLSEIDGVKFRELSPEQYLTMYKLMLRDNYRQEKRGSADEEKIALIQKYIQRQKVEKN